MNVRRSVSVLVAGVVSLLVVACGSDQPLVPAFPEPGALAAADAAAGKAPETPGPNDQACWGQATAVYAQTGEMGQHASEQENPRIGLRNLARSLYELGIIEEDTMQALGAFVAAEYKLSIDACM